MRALLCPAQGRAIALAVLVGVLSACQVLPPEHRVTVKAGSVRARTPSKASEVAALLERLEPEVVALLPEARPRSVDVWVQQAPALYRFALRAYQDADGFYSDSEERIHLREGADSLERTLAHELTHAHLRGAWFTLPGTLEEGLCDHVSGELCPSARSRLRAGRLSCAAFALGGLALDLSLRVPAKGHPETTAVGFQARMRLEGEPPMEVDPLGVFERQAGLSSSRLAPAEKKAYYGLAYLVVERIVKRVGVAGLHDLCARARRAEGREARDALLDAAELDVNPSTWRVALEQELEPGDLVELARTHPDFLVQALDEFCSGCMRPDELLAALPDLEARLAVAGTDTSIDLLAIGELREGLSTLWRERGLRRLAGR